MNNQYHLLVLADYLIEKEGLVYYKEAPFSGIKIDCQNEVIINKALYRDGVYIGKADLLIPNVGVQEIIHGEWVKVDELSECVYYQNKQFTGLMYTFKKGVCKAIEEFDLGWDSSFVFMTVEGKLTEIFRNGDGYTESVKWNKNGYLVDYRASFRVLDKFSSLALQLGEYNCVERLVTSRGFFENLSKIKGNASHLYLSYFTLDKIIKLPLAEKLTFTGDETISNLFSLFAHETKLQGCKELILRSVISPEAISIAIKNTEVEKVIFHEMRNSPFNESDYRSWLANIETEFRL